MRGAGFLAFREVFGLWLKELAFLVDVGVGQFHFLGAPVGKEVLVSGVEDLVSLCLVDHAIVQQELNISM